MTELISGKIADLNRDPANWIFLDIGFAGTKSKTSGIILPDQQDGENVSWATACEEICRCVSSRNHPVNLMIEAPLSIAFDRDGNPTGRIFEKKGNKTRYWYLQGGASVLMAAALLIHQIAITNGAPVRLFESFISFKTGKTDHKSDAMLMRRWVQDLSGADTYEGNNLVRNDGSKIVSATSRFGIDFGIPPVIAMTAQ
jgi:hypothetical protein